LLFFEPDRLLDRLVEEVLLDAAAARFVPVLRLAVFFAPPRAEERAAVFFAPERAPDFFAAVFLAPVFLAAVFLAPVFRAAVFLAPPLFFAPDRAAVFLAPDFLVAPRLVDFAAVLRAPLFRPLELRFLVGVDVEEPPFVMPVLSVFDLSSVGIAASFKGLRATPSRLIKATSLYQASSD
jgi:hypothetical protein